MELLHLLKQDTKLNIITSSECVSLEPKPVLNVKIIMNEFDQVETLLSSHDYTQYDVVVYLTTIHEVKLPDSIKVLVQRKFNGINQMLLSETTLYESIPHYTHLKWLRPKSILDELCKCHSPFSRVLINYNSYTANLCCDKALVSLSDTLIDDINYESKHSNLYAGLILYESSYDVSKYQPDFIAEFNVENAINYPYQYTWDHVTISCKRTLSSVLTSLQQLHHLQVDIETEDMFNTNTNLINKLHSLGIPCHLREKKWPSNHRIVLNHNASIPNINTFLQYLRKLPPLSSFGLLVLDKHDHYASQGMNDTFALVKEDAVDDVIGKTNAYLYSSHRSFVVISPYIPAVDTSSILLQPKVQTRKVYYTPTIGDADLADQMTEYASISGEFEVGVDVKKLSMLQLQNTFQNIRFKEMTKPTQSSFQLSVQPQKSTFIFHSSIVLQAQRYLSKLYQSSCVVLGIHQKCKRVKRSFSCSCSLQYYEDGLKRLLNNFQDKSVAVVLCNASRAEDNLLPMIQSFNVQVHTMPEWIDLATQMAVLSVVDGLILSTSSFAFWAGVMNSNSSNIVSPTKWVTDIYAMAYKAYNETCIQPSWIPIVNC